MERPALRRLLDDVRAGKVDTVLSYKVDRLTRALADFARIVAIFEAAEVAFVSVTESFDTSSAMGRLTLHILLSFAQFEREIAGERIRDKVAASRARGLWTGGTVPIGYRIEVRALMPAPEEAALVRQIFERYLALGSVTALKAELDAAGIRTPEQLHRSGRCSGDAAFSRGRLYDLLANPIFTGRIRHGDRVHPGQHAAIVDMDVWQAAQDQFAASRVSRSLRRGSRASSPLAGRLVDPDGRAMRPSHASSKGRRYRYYVSGDLVDGSAATGATGWRVPAAEIEAAVARVLAARLRDPEFQAEALRSCSPAPAVSKQILNGIATLAERLDAPGSTSGREALRLVVTRVELSTSGLQAEARFPAPDSAGGPADPARAALPAFAVTAPLEVQRRGPELRLVLQGAVAPPPPPDPRLVRTQRQRHRPARGRRCRRRLAITAARLSRAGPGRADPRRRPAARAHRRAAPALGALPLLWHEQRALLG